MFKTLKIDVSFPEYREKELIKLLEEGWKIHNKTVVNERYIYFVLAKLSA